MNFYDAISIVFLGLLLIPIGIFVITLINMTLEEVRYHNTNISLEPQLYNSQSQEAKSKSALRLVK